MFSLRMHIRAGAVVSEVTQAVQKLHVAQGIGSSTLQAWGTPGLALIPIRLQIVYATSRVAAAANTACRAGSPATVLAS